VQIQFNTFTLKLEELPLDVGYASEPVKVTGPDGTPLTLGGQNGKTQLLITTPFVDDAFIEELKEIDAMLPSGGEYEVTASLIVANATHSDPGLEKIAFCIDSDGEFGDWYGVRLVGEPCDGELTKAAILVSKDGALFYDDFVTNLHDRFKTDTLLRKITAAQLCYTGKGCH